MRRLQLVRAAALAGTVVTVGGCDLGALLGKPKDGGPGGGGVPVNFTSQVAVAKAFFRAGKADSEAISKGMEAFGKSMAGPSPPPQAYPPSAGATKFQVANLYHALSLSADNLRRYWVQAEKLVGNEQANTRFIYDDGTKQLTGFEGKNYDKQVSVSVAFTGRGDAARTVTGSVVRTPDGTTASANLSVTTGSGSDWLDWTWQEPYQVAFNQYPNPARLKSVSGGFKFAFQGDSAKGASFEGSADNFQAPGLFPTESSAPCWDSASKAVRSCSGGMERLKFPYHASFKTATPRVTTTGEINFRESGTNATIEYTSASDIDSGKELGVQKWDMRIVAEADMKDSSTMQRTGKFTFTVENKALKLRGSYAFTLLNPPTSPQALSVALVSYDEASAGKEIAKAGFVQGKPYPVITYADGSPSDDFDLGNVGIPMNALPAPAPATPAPSYTPYSTPTPYQYYTPSPYPTPGASYGYTTPNPAYPSTPYPSTGGAISGGISN